MLHELLVISSRQPTVTLRL